MPVQEQLVPEKHLKTGFGYPKYVGRGAIAGLA